MWGQGCATLGPHVVTNLLPPPPQVPGLGLRLDTTKLDLQYQSTYKKELPDAYERLLLDVVNGEDRSGCMPEGRGCDSSSSMARADSTSREGSLCLRSLH